MSERILHLPGGRVDLLSGVGTVAGRQIRLAERECVLLRALHSAEGRPVDRAALEECLGLPPTVDRAVLDAAVYRLRAKIERRPMDPTALLSAHGHGYRLVAAPGPSPAPPPRLSSLVGRRLEQQQLRGAEGWTTVTGPPGVGKTSMALWLAHQVDTPVIVDLVPAVDTPGVAAAVMGALGGLGLGGHSASELVEEVARTVAAASISLLVLDNAEHVLDEVAALLSALREAAPGLRIVVTSRQPVGGDGEDELRLQPLSPSAASALLVQRAQEMGGTSLAREAQVAELVDHLDRLPLAIELVAARTRTMTLDQILARLPERFRLLRETGRAEGRHHAMEATLWWSWDLLDDDLQQALAQASVFVGPLRDAPCRAVLGEGADQLLDGLERASWLVRGPRGLSLLQSVRAFGRARLAELGGVVDAERAHARAFVEEAQQLRFGGGHHHPAVLDAMDDLLPDLLAVERRAATDPELVAQVALVLFDCFDVRGPLPQHERLVDVALDVLDPLDPAAADLWFHRSVWARRRDDTEGALLAVNEALSRASSRRALYLAERASTLGRMGRTQEALDAVEQSLRALEDPANTSSRSVVIAINASVLRAVGPDPDRAEAMLRDALAHPEDGWHATFTRSHLAQHLHHVGRLDEALVELERSAEELQRFGAEPRRATVLHSLAGVHAELGRLGEAIPILDEAERLYVRNGYRGMLTQVKLFRARILLDVGAHDEAVEAMSVHEVVEADRGVGRAIALALAGHALRAEQALADLDVQVSGVARVLAEAHVARALGQTVDLDALRALPPPDGIERLYLRLLERQLGGE